MVDSVSEVSKSTMSLSSSVDDINNFEGNTKWLSAHYDPVATIYTFTTCIALADLNGDGDHKLIIADLGTGMYNMKLKVYKGTSLMSESTIIDLPTGVVTFHMDSHEPRVPAVAVASGPHIYIYKNLRPYFKFTLPSLEINSAEQDIWNQAKQDKMDVTILREMLECIRGAVTDSNLTTRSQRFLMLEPDQLETFANLNKHAPLKRQTVITCVATLKKSMADDDAISCLVVGTENKDIYIIDPEAFTVLTAMTLSSVPVFLSVSGLYDVEFRIIAACRDGKLYPLKRGYKAPKTCIELSSQVVGMVRIGKTIVVGCMDDTLVCFTTKGKKLWTTKMNASIIAVEVMEYHSRGFIGVLVALNNREVHLYKDKFLVNIIKTDDVVTAMKFGRFGREEGSLIMITRNGSLLVKILKRTTQFEEKATSIGPPVAQSIKLNIPKKTKLFVDQTMREREQSIAMHRAFQQDLARIHLATGREFVKSLEASLNPISSNPEDPLKLTAQVQGIGPDFKLLVHLQNTSHFMPSINLCIAFHYDNKLYSVKNTYISVPFLVPGLLYSYETEVQCINDKGISDNIKVFVLHQGNSIPIITAIISMPVSEHFIVS